MRVFHTCTNVPPWDGVDAHARLDAALHEAGSTPVRLPWTDFETCEDGVHFTEAGYDAFCDALAVVLDKDVRAPVVLVLADSTIDHNDRDDDGTWHGRASARLRERVRPTRVVVDAVCGSGFVARAREGEHFRARLARLLRGDPSLRDAALLLVGGWNDAGRPATRVCAAASACVALATRE